METVNSYARLAGQTFPTDKFGLEDGVSLLRKIEYYARISHASEDAQTDDSWNRFVRSVVLGHGDWSVVEHATVTVIFIVDRGISHELVRHRLFSFTQSSTRFINYVKKMLPSFIVVPFIHDEDGGSSVIWRETMQFVETQYQRLIDRGEPPQLARSVFPNSLSTKLAVTGNLRNWRHHLIMRTTRETHPQYREVSIPLLAEFKEKIPILFEDIEPMLKQSEAIKKAR